MPERSINPAERFGTAAYDHVAQAVAVAYDSHADGKEDDGNSDPG